MGQTRSVDLETGFSALLILSRTAGSILRMVLGKLVQVCDEELRKAARAMIAVWDLLGEADARALQGLFLLLRIR
jgi:hypothetical protein